VTAVAALACAVPLIGGALVSGHSHVRDFISELGAVGTQWGAVVSFGGFLPIGLLTLAFLIVAAPLVDPRAGAKVGYYLLSCVGFAYLGAAFAPCGFLWLTSFDRLAACTARKRIERSLYLAAVMEYH